MNRNALWATLSLVLAFLWLQGIKQAGANEARAEIAEARADSLYRTALEKDDARKADSVRYARERQRLVESKDSALARADRLAEARPQIVERIIRVAGDSARVVHAVGDLELAHEEETRALRHALDLADSLRVGAESQLTVALFTNQALRDALEAARSESRAWEQAGRPKLLGILPASPNTAYAAGVLSTAAVVVWAVLR